MSDEIEDAESFDFSKAQPRLDELLKDKKPEGKVHDDLKYVRASYNGVHEENRIFLMMKNSSSLLSPAPVPPRNYLTGKASMQQTPSVSKACSTCPTVGP